MIIKKIRYIILFLFLFFCYILFNSWENEKKLNEKIKVEALSNNNVFDSSNIDLNVSSNQVIINTNLLFAKIDLNNGGDINYLSLKNYFNDLVLKDGIVLFDKSDSKFYFAQSGFFEKFSSNSTNLVYNFLSNKLNYEISNGDSNLYVNLKFLSDKFILNKVYIFKNYSYEININLYLHNLSSDILYCKFYGFIKNRNFNKTSSSFLSNRSNDLVYSLFNDKKPYNKFLQKDLNKSIIFTNYSGWMAASDNYFISAFVPNYNYEFDYNIEKIDEKTFILKCFNNSYINILPNEVRCIDSVLFVGPKIKDYLNKIRSGLDLSIDYGIFWPICSTIFIMLSKIFNFVKNWGLAIIIVTVLIKILFFHLSSISYKSIGNMKKLQPNLDLIKDRYKDDKSLMSQAIIDLYRKEKINPLAGCLPILVQIPVFISLYYVLLESVELRHASFFLWINDLSSKDPYYLLPFLMAITMFLQQKLNPPIQDPLQAKVVMFMPFLFLFLFLQFPSGLILYWVVNNILSIIQQWFILKYN